MLTIKLVGVLSNVELRLNLLPDGGFFPTMFAFLLATVAVFVSSDRFHMLDIRLVTSRFCGGIKFELLRDGG